MQAGAGANAPVADEAEGVPGPSEPRSLSYAVGMNDVIAGTFEDGDAQDGQNVEGPRAPPGTPVTSPFADAFALNGSLEEEDDEERGVPLLSRNNDAAH
ncbi:hypothetical protein EJ06DRAFT_526600 [Trichodelitschia bisporula]|uniref:Uncharacterized protein n=1 Tax=Trichodelitschia bisporula TaxID=703511 RepID=A0A6G1I950_9PEZI|nr:hypothetical protein EJ06DRAFT_526600 [Trichodelitschia bisporula]